jgi:hypothetical protein
MTTFCQDCWIPSSNQVHLKLLARFTKHNTIFYTYVVKWLADELGGISEVLVYLHFMLTNNFIIYKLYI